MSSIMKLSLTALLFLTLIRPTKACEVIKNVAHTFYGYPDNDPPGPDILYDCGRGNTAGGVGTYDDPLTFASGAGEFEECQIIYMPYLRKYLRHEDFCEACDKNWDKGKYHVDVWTGSASVNGKEDQIECENALTPPDSSIVVNPTDDFPVDDSELYSADGNVTCNVGHVFRTFDEESYC